MAIEIGVLFAFGALIFWGFGDFLIQRSTRRVGDWETLFVIVGTGAIILTPFVWNDLAILSQQGPFLALLAASSVITVAAMFDFESLKRGKIAIIKPVCALEVPIAAVLAIIVISETLGMAEIILISTLVIGLIMISLRSHHFSRKAWIERGVFLAIVGAILMGMSNFLIALGARITNPLMVIWFSSMFMSMICIFYLMTNRRLGNMMHDFRRNPKLMLSVGVMDNLAWISFAFAASLIPISIAVALSESYIALAALLGLMINRERLSAHQKVGLITALGSAALLAGIVA